jgi:hypothetical protein
MELLVIYIIAILIIVVVAWIVYSSYSASQTIPLSVCTFSGGASCVDMIIGTNTVTSNTQIILFLSNSQQYALTNPSLVVQISNTNSTSFPCGPEPNYVKPGGAIVCIANLTQKSALKQLVTGNFYLTANYCGFATSGQCPASAPTEIYKGQFEGYSQPSGPIKLAIKLAAQSTTVPADGQHDMLTAQVTLFNNPVPDATINFTANAAGYTVAPQYVNTNSTGYAVSYVWSYTPGVVTVYANFSGLLVSAHVTITFTRPAAASTTSTLTTTSSSTTSTTTISGPGSTTSTTSSSTSTSTTTTTVSYSSYIYCIGGAIGHTADWAAEDTNTIYYAQVSPKDGSVSGWSTTTPYPTEIVSPSCATSNGYIYCIGGYSGQSVQPTGVWYNTVYYAKISNTGAIGTWQSGPNYPGPRYAFTGPTPNGYVSCSIYSGYLYCAAPAWAKSAGSYVQVEVYSAPISTYDGSVGTWQPAKSPLSVQNTGCVAFNGNIYCIGNIDSTYDVYYAPLSSGGTVGSWIAASTEKEMPDYESGAPLTYNGYLYYVGGLGQTTFGGYGEYIEPYVYYTKPSVTDGSIGAWTQTNPYPNTIWHESCVPTYTGYIYCFGSTVASSGYPNGYTDFYYAPLSASDGSVGGWISAPSPYTLTGTEDTSTYGTCTSANVPD